MTDKVLPCPQFCQDVRWDPFRGWAPPSMLYDQDFGLPSSSEAGEHDLTEGARRRLAGSCWPGYTLPHLFIPPSQIFLQPSFRLLKQLSGGLSEVRSEQGKWTISLDVNQFSPEDIGIRTREGYLEITGKHEERQDEHGFVSRCFIRKYNLPANLDLEHVTSYVSGDGVLSVEIPLHTVSDMDQQNTVIPIQVGEKPLSETEIKKEEKENPEEAAGKSYDSSEEKKNDAVDPPPPATQVPEADPELEDVSQQASGVVSAGTGTEDSNREPAGVEESAAGSGADQVPSEEIAGTQPLQSTTLSQAEQQSSGIRNDEEQEGASQLPEAPPAPDSEQEEQEAVIQDKSSMEESPQVSDEPHTEGAGPTPGQSEYSPQGSEEPPAESAEQGPSQSDEHQSSESQIPKEEDIEQAVEQPTKA